MGFENELISQTKFPHQPSREVPSRVANFPCRAGSPGRSWKPSRACRLRAGICRQRRGLGKVESWASAEGPFRFRASHKSNCVTGRFGRSASGFGLSGARRKVIVNGVLLRSDVFMEYFRLGRIITRFTFTGIADLEFESAQPSVVKSIKQR